MLRLRTARGDCDECGDRLISSAIVVIVCDSISSCMFMFMSVSMTMQGTDRAWFKVRPNGDTNECDKILRSSSFLAFVGVSFLSSSKGEWG